MSVGLRSDVFAIRAAGDLYDIDCTVKADASGAGAIIVSSSTGEVPIHSFSFSAGKGVSTGSSGATNSAGAATVGEGVRAEAGMFATGIPGRDLSGAGPGAGAAGRAVARGLPCGTGVEGAVGRIDALGFATGAEGRCPPTGFGAV